MDYKLSKLLIEKGFNKDYLGSYYNCYTTKDISVDEVDWYGNRVIIDYLEGEEIYETEDLLHPEVQKNSTPIIELDAALRWLRKDKFYHIVAVPIWDCGTLIWTYKIYDISHDVILVAPQGIDSDNELKFEEYEDALEAGIKYLMTN